MRFHLSLKTKGSKVSKSETKNTVDSETMKKLISDIEIKPLSQDEISKSRIGIYQAVY